MSLSKKLLLVLGTAIMTLVIAASAFAMKEKYNYMSAASLQKAIENKADIAIIDIQESDDFKAHHIKGAVETCAYPVKSDSDKIKLEASLNELKDSTKPVVVICPRGKGGAERTVDYFVKKGIAPYRVFILTEGQGGWSYSVETE
ncbi:rhodanese-like domain-containing protein [Maridesulfovibrio zosterae]|uniref:rhodanese-like domain-containing protein n=1 Tax=Maridesulfovibrio zosterae TaxID=82171 RepID=UPI000422CEA2|nr:rhodanese-like domain-containing protein [Maridesulfovibrio zosterae]